MQDANKRRNWCGESWVYEYFLYFPLNVFVYVKMLLKRLLNLFYLKSIVWWIDYKREWPELVKYCSLSPGSHPVWSFLWMTILELCRVQPAKGLQQPPSCLLKLQNKYHSDSGIWNFLNINTRHLCPQVNIGQISRHLKDISTIRGNQHMLNEVDF